MTASRRTTISHRWGPPAGEPQLTSLEILLSNRSLGGDLQPTATTTSTTGHHGPLRVADELFKIAVSCEAVHPARPKAKFRARPRIPPAPRPLRHLQEEPPQQFGPGKESRCRDKHEA